MSVSPAAFLSLLFAAAALADDPPRPRLQFINGSTQPADIFWLKSDTERVPNGSVEPGKDTFVTTTIGHRFVIVGREDKAEAKVTCAVPVQALRFDPAGKDGVPAFYTQRVEASGFPIVASAKVNPYALKEAAYLMDLMLAKRPDVRTAMIQSGARLCVMAHNEFTTELPEFVRLKPKDYWDARARGLGGSTTDPLCSCGEENLLAFYGDPYSTENIFIHEFAHNIHLRGMVNVDPTFDPRLTAAYDAAMKAGLWRGKYAATNAHEYWAEGVQSWFDDNRENDHDHNHVNTRAELEDYDPGLAALCREVFGDTELKYTKPTKRLTGHLTGYDPSTAPVFVWPGRLAKERAEIRAKAQARDRAAQSHELRVIVGWTVHVSKALIEADPAAVENASGQLAHMLQEIMRVVPAPAVAELRKVPLWFSPEYKGTGARAEYHPDAGWLRANDRDPAMAKAVEFTNVRIFDAERRRMPNFALHELAHAYHDRVLNFDEPRIRAAFEQAKASGKYESVRIRNGAGKEHTGRAYTISNHKEYFAETTEAFFSRNDIYPFTRDELKEHDPDMFALLGTLWGTDR